MSLAENPKSMIMMINDNKEMKKQFQNVLLNWVGTEKLKRPTSVASSKIKKLSRNWVQQCWCQIARSSMNKKQHQLTKNSPIPSFSRISRQGPHGFGHVSWYHCSHPVSELSRFLVCILWASSHTNLQKSFLKLHQYNINLRSKVFKISWLSFFSSDQNFTSIGIDLIIWLITY